MISFVSIKVLISLMDGKIHPAKVLAEENEVSTKTIARAIDTLMEAGVFISSKLGKNGGYYIEESFIPKLLGASCESLSELLSYCEFKKSVMPSNSQDFHDYVISSTPKQKVKDVLKLSSKIVLDSLPWGNKHIATEKFDLVYNACIDDKVIFFDYINYNHEISHRELYPYCMTMKNGSWYVYGECSSSEKFKLFKLTRISNIEVSCTHFQRKQIDTSIKPWNNINSTRKTKIQIEFLPAYKDEICEWLNLDNITNNGEIVSASAEVQDSDNLYTKLIQEANKVKLISPLSMVKKLVEKCKNIEQIYLA